MKQKVTKLVCPKNYSHFDQMVKDCPDCGEAKLYQVCQNGRNHLACAGWINKKGCNCCSCYEEIK